MSTYPTASVLSTPTGLTLDELKEALFNNLRYRLGDGMIDIELDPQHYEAALIRSLVLFSIHICLTIIMQVVWQHTTFMQVMLS